MFGMMRALGWKLGRNLAPRLSVKSETRMNRPHHGKQSVKRGVEYPRNQ
jgi:hypothetical protein